MSTKSGQAITVLFSTANASTGAATDATGTPTGTLYVNGTANGATVTVTNLATGLYKAAVTLPSLSAGDVVSLRAAATVATVAGEGVIWQEVADTERTSDLNDLTAAQVNAEVDTALADYDGPTNAEMVARTLAAADYFDPAADTVANVTTVGSVTGAVGSVTGAVGSVTGAVGSVTGNVGGNVTGSVGSVAAGGITAASIATNAIDADALAADAGTELGTAVWATAARTLTASSDPTAAAIADAVWDEILADHVAAGSTGEALGDVPTNAELAVALAAADDAVLAAIAALNNISAAQVNAEVVDALRTDTIPDSYSVDGAQPTIAQAILEIRQFMMERAISSTTMTVKKPDGTTTAFTLTMDDDTSPTSITRAS